VGHVAPDSLQLAVRGRTDRREASNVCSWLGVQHIFLTDNDSNNSKQALKQLGNEFPADFLTIRHETLPRAQLPVYAWCAEEQRGHFNWLAFFDVDEFLAVRSGCAHSSSLMHACIASGILCAPAMCWSSVKAGAGCHADLRHGWQWNVHVGCCAQSPCSSSGAASACPNAFESGCRASLSSFLDTYKAEAGLLVHMVLMGPSGREFRPSTGGVLPYYDQCKEPERMVKAITNTFFLSGLAQHPHNFWYQDGRMAVNEHFLALNPTWRLKPNTADPDCSLHPNTRQCYLVPSSSYREEASADHIALYHYVTKSREDFALKQARGSGMSAAMKDDTFFKRLTKCASSLPRHMHTPQSCQC
jgi:hypothetical protein